MTDTQDYENDVSKWDLNTVNQNEHTCGLSEVPGHEGTPTVNLQPKHFDI